MGIAQKFDVIVTNGLTIYEKDDHKVIDLYRQFFDALKPGGCLISSFVTAPPEAGKPSAWKMENVNEEDTLLQTILFVDIFQADWRAYRSEETVKEQLRIAGFGEMEILYDMAGMFPTAVATKPLML